MLNERWEVQERINSFDDFKKEIEAGNNIAFVRKGENNHHTIIDNRELRKISDLENLFFQQEDCGIDFHAVRKVDDGSVFNEKIDAELLEVVSHYEGCVSSTSYNDGYCPELPKYQKEFLENLLDVLKRSGLIL